jgi:hypothetical protein
MNAEQTVMIDSIILKWKRLIKWLAEERLAKERRNTKSK